MRPSADALSAVLTIGDKNALGDRPWFNSESSTPPEIPVQPALPTEKALRSSTGLCCIRWLYRYPRLECELEYKRAEEYSPFSYRGAH